MNEVQKEKECFVRYHVEPMCRAIDSSIDNLWYSVTDGGTELVTIQRHNKSVVRIDVTADSLAALARDVLSIEDILKGVRT